MKFNTVLPEKAYWYYTALKMLVCLNTTKYLKNVNLFWKYASAQYLIWDEKKHPWSLAIGLGKSLIHWTIFVLEIAARNPKEQTIMQ